MAGSKVTKKIFQYAYGIGASIVIVGALAKILHADILGMSGSFLLAVGMGTEAVIFFMSAFEPQEEDLDWSLVYPELKGGAPLSRQGVMAQQSQDDKLIRESLSEKLDNILREAHIDANLMNSLATSIRNFEGAAKNIGPVADAVASTRKYGEELTTAAVQLEALNSLYRIQLERTELQVNAQEGMVDNLNSLNAQVNSFKEHLRSLNTVYGGMLSAMGGAR